MSIKRLSVLAPTPGTALGRPTHLSADSKGERLAYASNKSIFLRSIDNPTHSVQYTQHTHQATVARFSPSGYYVASGDISGKIRVWDCVGEDQILKGEFPIISGPINDLAWDGESKRIIAVGEGKESWGRCVTFDTGNSVGEVSGHSNPVNSVSIRPVRPYRAATASDDRTIVFYHGPPFKFNSQLREHHTNFVQGVAFSPTGDHLVSVGSDRAICIFDGKTGEFKSKISSGEDDHKGAIFSVSWSTDSKHFVTSSADQTVKLWDVETQKASHTWKFGPGSGVTQPHQQAGVVWPNRTDGTIISLSMSGDLNYLTEKDEKPYRVVTGHQKSITALGVVPDGKTIFTGSYEGRVCSWDITKGEASIVAGQTHRNQVSGIETGVGKVFSVGWDDTLRAADPVSNSFVDSGVAIPGQPKGISATGKDGELAIATQSGVYVMLNGEVVKRFEGKINYTPTTVTASAASTEIAVGADNNKVYVYSASDSALIETAVLTDSRGVISALAYSSTGTLLAAGDSTGKIVLYNRVKEGEYTVKSTRWAFHTGRVNQITWNAKDSHVVSVGLDTNMFVYSVENPGKNIKFTGAHKDGVNAVGWVDEGKVVTAGSDGAVKVWEVKL
ncbi:WD40 repeat-like protein [Terfezia boudieri ATCC MYA-4762]|uniref:WD40 repeat-like protein n=1 Tax=Terfezia boudieri ATCC MYA-4762 TaxID=1051890 RepID=A0A3N4LFT8_9PEZI|nr:WD40 repeat-like protein [Terfezia boudieri ATCC MYA-4762]